MTDDENLVDHDEKKTLSNSEEENYLSSLPLSKRYRSIDWRINYISGRIEMVLESSTDSMIDRQINNVLRGHFLEQRPITWRPVKTELVINTELTEEFFRKLFSFSFDSTFSLYLFFPIYKTLSLSEVSHFQSSSRWTFYLFYRSKFSSPNFWYWIICSLIIVDKKNHTHTHIYRLSSMCCNLIDYFSHNFTSSFILRILHIHLTCRLISIYIYLSIWNIFVCVRVSLHYINDFFSTSSSSFDVDMHWY